MNLPFTNASARSRMSRTPAGRMAAAAGGTAFFVLLYLAAIVAANLTIARLGASVAAGVLVSFLFIGLDLSTRDRLHDAWSGRSLAAKMALLIAAGSLVSWLLNRNAGPIALASFGAFAGSASLDALTYHLLGKKAYLVKVNGSNLGAAAADSLLFPALAFGLPLPLAFAAGQFAAKALGGFFWSLLLKGRRGKTGMENGTQWT